MGLLTFWANLDIIKETTRDSLLAWDEVCTIRYK